MQVNQHNRTHEERTVDRLRRLAESANNLAQRLSTTAVDPLDAQERMLVGMSRLPEIQETYQAAIAQLLTTGDSTDVAQHLVAMFQI